MLERIVSFAFTERASDVHLKPGIQPVMRVDGKMIPIDHCSLDEKEYSDLIHILLTSKAASENCREDSAGKKWVLEEKGEVDISHVVTNFYDSASTIRTRINIYYSNEGINMAIRILPQRIPSLQELKFPASVIDLAKKNEGLVIVSGPTGSGKSTTLAAMVDFINETRCGHILTLEDPIEYLHKPKKSIISQREIADNTASFASGLRAALREDPDVILIGEIRDRETMETALAAAETGHLVLGTLHTGSVVEAVDRVIQFFPAERQSFIKNQLANCFQGIISQKLIRRKEGKGRIAALEILLRSHASVHTIRDGKTETLPELMRYANGMQTMEDAVKDLVSRNLIEDC